MNMYRLFAGCLMAVSFATPDGAHAACQFINNKTELLANFALKSEYQVAPGTAVGTVLDDVSIPVDAVAFAKCTAPGQSNRSVYGGTKVGSSVTPYTFATGVPGIGLAFYDMADGVVPASFGGSSTRYWGAGDGDAYAGNWGWWGWVGMPLPGARLGVKVIVTGPVGAGDAPAGSLSAQMKLDGLSVATLTTTGFRVTTPACAVPDLSVDMGQLVTNRFTGAGSSAGDTPFDLRLNACPAGRTGIYYRFDPTTQVVPGTGDSVATLNGASSATGIGLQLLDASGKPVAFGTTAKVTRYAGAAGDYSVPLRARFYQTAAAVTAGSANASITVTMSYD
ncbi:TPA: type 1 fimbrial protein [Burkholderia vietnamiensis]|uniref:fimbrial protein n=1 Tax=Burkholderia vietnamiensis TaxID=60552 RepID=UPI001589A9E8|nr:fimbrial protein [Burkholderia vietnamiensis]HDR9106870.1 type 1 fimbrial protein [Burkholderia vietnamiensis]